MDDAVPDLACWLSDPGALVGTSGPPVHLECDPDAGGWQTCRGRAGGPAHRHHSVAHDAVCGSDVHGMVRCQESSNPRGTCHRYGGGLAAYSFLKGVAQELFIPWEPQQRLIACRNGIASYCTNTCIGSVRISAEV